MSGAARNPNVAVGLQVKGGREFRASVRKAGGDLKDLSAIHREVAGIVLPVAKAKAPRGTGRNGHIVSTMRAAATQRRAEIRAGDRARPYGPILQWGWRARGIAPHAWVAEAARETEPRWLPRYERWINDLINHVKGA